MKITMASSKGEGRDRRRRLLRVEGEMPTRPELMEMERIAAAENREAKSIVVQLAKLSEATGMPITQENGQRCYGPPRDSQGFAPAKGICKDTDVGICQDRQVSWHVVLGCGNYFEIVGEGCEVFVGKLPRHVYEPQLVPLFSRVGRIFRIRLMMDFSGTNRGYCFVQYMTRAEAERAIRELNGYEIMRGRHIGVLKSVDNCRLIVGGLPKDKSEEEILIEISQHTDGAKRVVVYPSAEGKTKNRGFAFVEYENHKAAAMARRKLIPGNIRLWGRDLCVDWAEPEPEGNTLYVCNLMAKTSEETLRQIFNHVSSNGVELVRKINNYAFIRFASPEQADAGRMALNRAEIDGSEIEVSWARKAPPAERLIKSSAGIQHRQSQCYSSKRPQLAQNGSQFFRGKENYSALDTFIAPQPVMSRMLSPLASADMCSSGPTAYYGSPTPTLHLATQNRIV